MGPMRAVKPCPTRLKKDKIRAKMSGVVILALRLLMAAALYGFLAWALWTLWRDLKRQNELLIARQAPPLTLTIQESGKAFTYYGPVIRIGRDLVCDCRLDDQTVSTQHARLSFHHNQWWLEDLGSTNGTFLNQDPITFPVVITRSDELQVGQVKMDISIGEQDDEDLGRTHEVEKDESS
jgi:hypothetical protein